MKIGIAGGYLSYYGFSEGLKRMKAQGYECLDDALLANTDNDIFSATPAEFERKLTERRKEIEDNGIIVSQTHGPWRWPPKDATEEDRKERFEKMSMAIVGTALMGTKNFIIHPIMPYGCDRERNPRMMWEMNLDFFGKLLEVAIANDVIINFENMPMVALAMASVPSTLDFVKAINSPNFKMCLDTGHCAILGMDIGEAVRLIGKDYLQTLHVHDNNGNNDSHWIPYTGVCNWSDFAKALQEIDFQGSMSLETFIPRQIPDDLRPLQEQSLFQMACKIAGRTF